MNVLEGVRVLVVDDVERDAFDFIRALSRMGIGAAYFNGKPEDLGNQPQGLRGVRLAVLDMDLDLGGTSDSSKAAALANYLGLILGSDNGPYGVMAWTNHVELVQHFERYAFGMAGLPKPMFTLCVAKADCRRGDTFDTRLIAEKFDAQLAQFGPLQVLVSWERESYWAATSASNALSSFAVTRTKACGRWRKSWSDQMTNIMRAMVAAEAGSNVGDGGSVRALYRLLNPLHADRMECAFRDLPPGLLAQGAEIRSSRGACSSRTKAKLNTMLHLSWDGIDALTAGSAFVFSSLIEPTWFPSSRELIREMFDIGGLQPATARKALEDRLARRCRRIAVEVGAACDHAQDNVHSARLVAGLLVPSDVSKHLKNKGTRFLWRLEPIYLEKPVVPGHEYTLCLDSRYLVTVDLATAGGLRACVRLRAQALNEAQAWFAYQSGRPGKPLL